MKNKTNNQIETMAEARYGTDPHKYAQQRDGFIEGYKLAQRQANEAKTSTERKRLIAYEKNHYTPNDWALASETCVDEIDEYLKQLD